jgi:hypothetical protein
MNWGLLVLYLFIAFGLGIAAEKHGKERKGKHNFWLDLLAFLLQLVLIWWAVGWRFI